MISPSSRHISSPLLSVLLALLFAVTSSTAHIIRNYPQIAMGPSPAPQVSIASATVTQPPWPSPTNRATYCRGSVYSVSPSAPLVAVRASELRVGKSQVWLNAQVACQFCAGTTETKEREDGVVMMFCMAPGFPID